MAKNNDLTQKTMSPVATTFKLPKFVRNILIGLGVLIIVIVLIVLMLLVLQAGKKSYKSLHSRITNKSETLSFYNKIAEQQKKNAVLQKKVNQAKKTLRDCQEGLTACPDKVLSQQIFSRRLDSITPFKMSDETGKGNNDTVSSGTSSIQSVDAQTVLHPGYIIQAGQVIHAVLGNAIDSSLPGLVIGHLTEDVWSSDGSRVLMPRFTKLVGHYQGQVVQGMARINIIWDRASTPKPNPLSIDLESQSYDALGRAGQKADSIDSHFLQRFGMASLLSIIGASVATQGVGATDTQNSSDAMRQGIAASFQSASSTALSQGMAIPPTLHIYQGARITITVAKDLNFYKVVAHNG